MSTTTTDHEQSALERLEEALAHLHEMEPADASLVVQRLLEQIASERARRTPVSHGPR